MLTWQSSTFIAKPAPEVFAYVADLRNDPNWHRDVRSARLIEGEEPAAEGTVFDMDARVSGTMTVVVCEAPRRIVFKGAMKMNPIDTRTVTPVAGGVTFSRRVDVDDSGAMGWMMKRTRGMAAKRNDQFVQDLKQALEGSDRSE